MKNFEKMSLGCADSAPAVASKVMKPQTAALLWLFVVMFLVGLDQLTKYWACIYLKDQEPFVVLSHVLELSYLENRGMAFGMLQGKTVFLLLTCFVFFLLALYLYIKIPKTSYYLPCMILDMLLFAGALGNFLDRFFRGYVVDFIYISLIHFPVFNLADIYVVCGGILVVFFVSLKYRGEHDFDFLKWKS